MYRKNNLTETQILSLTHKLEIKFANSTRQKTQEILINDPRKTPKGKPVEDNSFYLSFSTNKNYKLQQKYNLSLPENFSNCMPRNSPHPAASNTLPRI